VGGLVRALGEVSFIIILGTRCCFGRRRCDACYMSQPMNMVDQGMARGAAFGRSTTWCKPIGPCKRVLSQPNSGLINV
jgi:hypothetical protein